MRREKKLADLTIDELKQLMVEKRRKVRSEHLQRFRKTGRVVTLVSDPEISPLEHLHTETQADSLAEIELSQRQKRKVVLDRLLLAVELLAVAGLFFVIYSAIQVLGDLNAQFAQSLIPSTLTPTPLIVPVILPSGHTPPNSPGGARPNEAEIPRHLMPLYQSLAQIPIPTSGPQQAIQIQIPKIEVDAPVVQGDGWEQLKKGVAQNIGSADPGRAGNMVLSAHNDVFGELFRHLDQLSEGDQIIVYSPQTAYTYIVTNIRIVKPTEVEVMAPTTEPTVTLISCYPYMVDNQRIIVQGSLQDGEN